MFLEIRTQAELLVILFEYMAYIALMHSLHLNKVMTYLSFFIHNSLDTICVEYKCIMVVFTLSLWTAQVGLFL